MEPLKEVLAQLLDEYPDETDLFPRTCGDDVIAKLPEPLREFYSLYGGADLPFGHIFPPEEALNDPVAKQAFESDGWFEFGCDDYFTFWLCRLEPDMDGLWFDPWDHDSETDPEAAFPDLASFLRALEEEF